MTPYAAIIAEKTVDWRKARGAVKFRPCPEGATSVYLPNAKFDNINLVGS